MSTGGDDPFEITDDSGDDLSDCESDSEPSTLVSRQSITSFEASTRHWVVVIETCSLFLFLGLPIPLLHSSFIWAMVE